MPAWHHSHSTRDFNGQTEIRRGNGYVGHVGHVDHVGQGGPGRQGGHTIDRTLIPSVWRTGRSQSAAARVNALANYGMEAIEIPAFLRKRAE